MAINLYIWRMEHPILDKDQWGEGSDFERHLTPKWKRFVHFVIDFYMIYLILFWKLPGSRLEALLAPVDKSWVNIVLPYFAVLVLYLLLEYSTGRTLGKFITGSKVISTLDEKLSFGQVALRTICRLLPFEPFSFLFAGSGWHDNWSNTAVVDASYKPA